MTESDNGHDEEVDIEELRELNDAIKAGMRRAGMHWMRAGYEVLAGLSAFLDEIATVGKDDVAASAPERGPEKIQLD